MAHITVEEIYRGEKYNLIGKVIEDYIANGRPIIYDKRTWIEMLIVKHSLMVAEDMIKEGDSVSTMIDREAQYSYVSWD